jgi:indolepyruvate ferredoxin oxidoreductase
MLAAMKALRGGSFDIFGYAAHRRMERDLIGWYRDLIKQVMDADHPRALEIAALPDQIRGYEQIKEACIAQTKKRAAEMLAESQRESTLV